MKFFRNIFYHTAGLATVQVTIFCIYFNMVMQLPPRTQKFLIIFAVIIVIFAIVLSMSIHFVDLRFAFDRLKIPAESRFASIAEWVEVDGRLAKYPFNQTLGTFFMWFVASLLTGIIFHYFLNYVTFADMIYMAVGGGMMGGIAAGYNYFFFKIDLAPIRRELAPAAPPPEWKPRGSMASMLMLAFFSICLALVIFPSSVLFHRMVELQRDSIRVEGETFLESLKTGMVKIELDGNKLSAKTLEFLEKNKSGMKGKTVIWNNGEIVYGSSEDISGEIYDKILKEKRGRTIDKKTGQEIYFGPAGAGNLEAATIFDSSVFRSGDVRLAKYMIFVMGLSLTMAIGLIIILRRYLGGALETLMGDVRAIDAGDLGRHIAVHSDGEIGLLELSLGSMKRRLVGLIEAQRGLVTQITDSISTLVRTASELREVAVEQSSSAAEQAVAVQEALSTSEEIVSTAAQIARNASSVYEVASQTLESCKEGSQSSDVAASGIRNLKDQVGVMSIKMESLATAGAAIQTITEMLMEISDNTKLLALNASLEAAGAGEKGKRFSVVASEVKRLAERATRSAGEIAEIITTLHNNINEASKVAEAGSLSANESVVLIDAVRKALDTISAFSSKTTQASQEISLSTNQQTSASRQMGETIVRVNEVAKQLETNSERLERSAESINDLSTNLMALLENVHHDEKTG